MPFGQIVLGPAGSGKTTYCCGMHDFLSQIGRPCTVINLDPANSGTLPYPCGLNIRELVDSTSVSSGEHLGPNGALMWSLEHVAENLSWLVDVLSRPQFAGTYFLIDCPGQIELYTHNDSIQRIVSCFDRKLHIRLVCVNLIDSVQCVSFDNFIAVVLVSLSTMIHFELPHINVLSKADLLPSYGELPFSPDVFSECCYLASFLQRARLHQGGEKHARFQHAIADLIDSYGLVAFRFLDIQSKEMVSALLSECDKANGYSI